VAGWAAEVMPDWAVPPLGISYLVFARSPADTNWQSEIDTFMINASTTARYRHREQDRERSVHFRFCRTSPWFWVIGASLSA